MTVEQKYFGHSLGSLGEGRGLPPPVNSSELLKLEGVISKMAYRSPP